jgi:hypothetical protein
MRAALLLALLALAPLAAAAPPPDFTPPPPPAVVDLGRQRYRVGRVKVDQGRSVVAVRGRVLRDAPPLEYIAVATKGIKDYESLLQLATSPWEFNVACLLIGLDAEGAKLPRYQFDTERIVGGTPVAVEVSWKADGRTHRVDAGDLVKVDQRTLERGEWVYIGAIFLPDGSWSAGREGSLVGFVHDPAAIIEHRTGLIGRFGDAGPNTAVAPPVGTHVTLRVRKAR